MTPREKLDFVNFLIFLRGKLQSLAIKLALEGEDHSKVDSAEERLAEIIRRLRVSIMQQWQGDATVVMQELRALNNKAQQKVRELERTVQKVEKVGEIVAIIDKGLAAVAKLVSPLSA